MHSQPYVNVFNAFTIKTMFRNNNKNNNNNNNSNNNKYQRKNDGRRKVEMLWKCQ